MELETVFGVLEEIRVVSFNNTFVRIHSFLMHLEY